MAELFWPFDPSIINYGFGYPPGYGGFHNGIDFPVPQGTPLRATVSGRIRNNDAGQADGAGVDISTPDGWMVRMWHVSQFLVPNGSQVSAGDVVALSGGQRGTWGAGNATGPHLHWGTMVSGNWVDPAGLNPKLFTDKPVDEIEDEMIVIARTDNNGACYVYNLGTGKYQAITSMDMLGLFQQVMKMWHFLDDADFAYYRENFGATFANVNTDLSINVDGIAQAIVDKIGSTNVVPYVTTKADIIESITANYPEDK